MDTADSALMVGAYGWAFRDAARQRTCDITVTALAVVLALVIAVREPAGRHV